MGDVAWRLGGKAEQSGCILHRLPAPADDFTAVHPAALAAVSNCSVAWTRRAHIYTYRYARPCRLHLLIQPAQKSLQVHHHPTGFGAMLAPQLRTCSKFTTVQRLLGYFLLLSSIAWTQQDVPVLDHTHQQWNNVALGGVCFATFTSALLSCVCVRVCVVTNDNILYSECSLHLLLHEHNCTSNNHYTYIEDTCILCVDQPLNVLQAF